jgi:hypothetical protein
MSRQMSIFANDSKTFQILRTYIRYKKLYSQSTSHLVLSEFVKEPSFRGFNVEMNLLIENCLKTDKNITQKHFQNLMDQHIQDNLIKGQLDLFYPLFFLTHFTEKSTVCLQFLLNKLDFKKLFEEYKQPSTDRYSKRIYWEIFLQAISRKMIHKADTQTYLETFITDFVIERNKGDFEYLVFKEELFENEAQFQKDFESFRKIIDKDSSESLFKNLWLFDKKLVQMMIVYFYVSIDLQCKTLYTSFDPSFDYIDLLSKSFFN